MSCVRSPIRRARPSRPGCADLRGQPHSDTTVIASGADGVPELSALVDEAWQLGATEICMQGPIPPTHLTTAICGLSNRSMLSPRRCTCIAFRPPEVRDGAARMGCPSRSS